VNVRMASALATHHVQPLRDIYLDMFAIPEISFRIDSVDTLYQDELQSQIGTHQRLT